MKNFPVVPPMIVKDTPKPRRLNTVEEARDYVSEAMALGRPAPWREVWHRLKRVASEEEAIEAIGDLRELLEEEDLLLPDDRRRQCGNSLEAAQCPLLAQSGHPGTLDLSAFGGKADIKMGRSCNPPRFPAPVYRRCVPRSRKFKHDHVCAISGAVRSKT